MVRRKRKDPLDEVCTIEDVKNVEKHRLTMFLTKSFAFMLMTSFSSVVFAYVYLSIKNNEIPSTDLVGGLFGHLFEIVKVVIGA